MTFPASEERVYWTEKGSRDEVLQGVLASSKWGKKGSQKKKGKDVG